MAIPDESQASEDRWERADRLFDAALDLPPDQRLEGTAAAVAVGIARGADIIRVHDVPFMLRAARMTDAIVRRGKRR